jgi:WD40 repeat protein
MRTGSQYGLAFLPDGKSAIISGFPTGIGRWDLVTGRRQHAYWDEISGNIALSHDGKLLLGGTNVVKLWDVATGRELHTFGDNVSGLALSPNGKVVALRQAGPDIAMPRVGEP